MFLYAISKRIIEKLPFGTFKINKDLFEKKTYKSDDEQIYTDEEKAKIVAASYRNTYNSKESKFLAPVVFLNTGIRDGEFLAIKWRDLTETHLHIRAEMIEKCDEEGNFIGFEYVDHPKTKAGFREIELNSEAKKAFSLVKKLNEEKGYPTGPDDFIFLRTHKGKVVPLTPRTVYSLIEKMCKEIQIPTKSAHDMRRTFATNLYYAGWPVKEIAKVMGHEQTSTTEGYIKYKPDVAHYSLEILV